MIDLEIPRTDFLTLAHQLAEACTPDSHELVEVTACERAVRFAVLGEERSTDAAISSPGAAQIPWSVFRLLSLVLKSSTMAKLQIQIEGNRLKVNAMRIRDAKIRLIDDRPMPSNDGTGK